MNCIIIGCHRKSHNVKECSYHLRLRLYGLCKNGCTTPAQAKHGYCSRCKLRGVDSAIIRKVGLAFNSETERYCWFCKTVKETDCFPLVKSAPYGHGGMCKNCQVKRNYGYDRDEVFEYSAVNVQQGVSCARCGSADDLQVDHIKPVSLGGTNDMHNLQILCGPCNKSKGNHYTKDYRVMVEYSIYRKR